MCYDVVPRKLTGMLASWKRLMCQHICTALEYGESVANALSGWQQCVYACMQTMVHVNFLTNSRGMSSFRGEQ